MLNTILVNLEQVGFGILLFILTYAANIGLGAWKSVKIDTNKFQWNLIGNSLLKFVVLGLSISLLSVVLSAIPAYATYVGIEIDAETMNTIDALVIIGAFLTATLKYVGDAIGKAENHFRQLKFFFRKGERMEPMQITITGTKVTITGDRVIGFQLNNLVNRFEATTDKDDTWQYTLYVYMIKPEKYNVINLNRQQDTNIIYVDLTADMMPFDGRYEMQFVANQYDTGEVFRTEKFQVWVENSIDPSPQWEPVPSEFYQIEDNIQKIYQETKQLYDEIQDGAVFDIDTINGDNAFGKNNIKELV